MIYFFAIATSLASFFQIELLLHKTLKLPKFGIQPIGLHAISIFRSLKRLPYQSLTKRAKQFSHHINLCFWENKKSQGDFQAKF